MIKRYSNFINESLIRGKLPMDSESDLNYIKHSFEDFNINIRIMDNQYHDNQNRLIHEQDKKYIDNNDVYVTKDVFIDGEDINKEEVKSIISKVVRKLEMEGYQIHQFNGTFGSGEINYTRLIIYPKVDVKESIAVPQISTTNGELPNIEYLRILTTEIEDDGVHVNFSNPIHDEEGNTIDIGRANRLLLQGGYEGVQKRDILSRKYFICYNVMFSVDPPNNINSYIPLINRFIRKLENDGYKCKFFNEFGDNIKDLLKIVIIYPK